MNNINKIIGVLGALSIGLASVCTSVSAADFTYNLPDSYFTDGASNSEYSPYLNSLKNNPNLSEFDSEKLIVLIGRNGDDLTFFILDPVQQYNTSNSYEGVVFLGDYTQFTCSASLISSYNFTVNSFNSDPLELQNGVFYNTANWGFDGFAVCSGQITDNNNFYTYSFGSRPAFYFTSLFSSYEPSYSGLLVGFPVSFQFNERDFYNWIIDNNKLSELPSYITSSKLLSFLNFYKQFGSSNTSFASRIVSWFSHMNIANQSNENIVILKQSIDKLYQEYINQYKHEFYSDSANQAHHRRNVNTLTTDDDLTLVTNDSNDDIYTTLLREIIRGVVAIQSNTVSGFRAVIDTLNNLDFTVNLANNGGNFVGTDLSTLWQYDSNAFDDDLLGFQSDIEDVQSVPMGYISTINQNSLMPENMLEDKNSLTVNVPTITGFTIGGNGSTYSTQTGTYTLSSSNYPWLDPIVKKIKRFGSIILIIGYLVHLRYRIPELVRGE